MKSYGVSMTISWSLVILSFLCLIPIHGEPTQKPRILVSAPQWHTGQWWRVRVPQLIASRNASASRDSTTDAVVYRFQVLGKRTLTFEEQDGREHIGQAVPPENCWLIVVTKEGNSQQGWPVSYHLYFRTDDCSLREIAEPGGRQGISFEFSSTHINDDEETRPVVMVDRSAYRSNFGPPVLDWPCFPLAAGSATANGIGTQTVNEIKTRFNEIAATGVQVTLRRGTDTTNQVWLPGLPWWVTAERNGLQQSRLVETSDNLSSGKIGL